MQNSKERPEQKNKKKRAARFVLFVILIFILSGVSSVLTDKYFFPWLVGRSFFEKYRFFKKGMENVTVINKTEQVTINEDQTISNYIGKSASSVVEIAVRESGAGDPAARQAKSVSGVIVAADGLVATYADSMFESKTAEFRIFTENGGSFSARVVVKDSFSNLVLLELVGAENLQVAEFIAPEDIKVGMKSAVIGRSGFNSEISLQQSIVGEIAKSFSIGGPMAASEKLQGVFFSDLGERNRRNENLSGGAVVDYNGNLVGISGNRKEDGEMKFFTVPVNHLQYVINQYLEKGKIERAALGVYYVLLSRETAFSGLSNSDHGALIFSPSLQQGLAVISGSAADKAGLKILDVILSVNGEEVNPSQNLAYLISKYKPGDGVNLKVLRDGKEMDISVILR